MAHGHHHDIVPPKKLELPSKFVTACIGCIIAGVVAFGIAFGVDANVAWKGYIIGFWFTLGLALFGPFFVSTQHLAIAGWSVSLRRIGEAFGAFIPVAAVLGIIGAFAVPADIWVWKHLDVAMQDPVFAKKAGFFEAGYFYGATIVILLSWVAGWFGLRSLSLKQDEEGGYAITNKLKAASCFFLVVFVVGWSFLAWYWIMSLEPNWFSTMFSVYTFAGLFQSGLALLYIVMLVLGRQGLFGSFGGGRQVHDLGKMVFGFTTFYAYIGFCQFLLIWYANIPEEDVWFIQRLSGDWAYFTLALPFLKFIIPFLIMLRQKVKKNHWNIMYFLCMWLVMMQAFEIWYWVEPPVHGLSVGHGGGGGAAHVSILNLALEMGITIGFFGAFALVAGKALAKYNIIPVKDPFLHESLPGFTHEPTFFEGAGEGEAHHAHH